MEKFLKSIRKTEISSFAILNCLIATLLFLLKTLQGISTQVLCAGKSTIDCMPIRVMKIDADLFKGKINKEEAAYRRKLLAKSSDIIMSPGKLANLVNSCARNLFVITILVTPVIWLYKFGQKFLLWAIFSSSILILHLDSQKKIIFSLIEIFEKES